MMIGPVCLMPIMALMRHSPHVTRPIQRLAVEYEFSPNWINIFWYRNEGFPLLQITRLLLDSHCHMFTICSY